jgi:hypothetical protein
MYPFIYGSNYSREYIYALFYTLGVEYYSTPSCYTEQNSVLFSTHVSVLFSIFEVLGVVLTDTERSTQYFFSSILTCGVE